MAFRRLGCQHAISLQIRWKGVPVVVLRNDVVCASDPGRRGKVDGLEIPNILFGGLPCTSGLPLGSALRRPCLVFVVVVMIRGCPTGLPSYSLRQRRLRALRLDRMLWLLVRTGRDV